MARVLFGSLTAWACGAVLATPLRGAVHAQGQAQRVVSGMTQDSAGLPIPYAQLDAPGIHVMTDAMGRFLIRARADDALELRLRRIGYLPLIVRLTAGSDTTVALTLAPIAQQLHAVKIASERIRALELSGFYARMMDRANGLNSAQFITPEEIEFRKAVRVTQLLDDRRGLLVRRVGSCSVIVRCWVALGPVGCIMTTYLNGARLLPDRGLMRASGWQIRADSGSVTYIDELVSPSEVSGIEIYQRGVNVPPQYQLLNGSCGVILIWTK